jgi:hypothetical protein
MGGQKAPLKALRWGMLAAHVFDPQPRPVLAFRHLFVTWFLPQRHLHQVALGLNLISRDAGA